MKNKQKNQDAAKPKALLLAENKGKFKKKDVAANGKVKNLAKLATAGLLKGDSLKDQVNVTNESSKLLKPVKNGKLNPAQVGLIVDDLLSKKSDSKQNRGVNSQFDVSDNGALSGKKKKKLKKDVSGEQKVNYSEKSDSTSPPMKAKKGGNSNAKLVSNEQSNLSASNSGSLSKSQRKKNKKKNINNLEQSETSDSSSSPAKKKADMKLSEKPDGKKANKRKATEIEDSGATKQAEKTKLNADDFKLVHKDVLKAVNAALNLHKKQQESSKKLLDSDPKPVLVKFTFYHSHPTKKIVRFNLEHSALSDSSDVCLIVADIKNKKNEETVAHWQDILKKGGVKISEVLPLASLRKDYTQFVDKRKLSDRFDCFLIQSNIYSRAFGLLGNTYFHEKRKTPVPVKLDGNFKHNIEVGLKKMSALYTAASRVFSIQVGHTEMKDKEIQENVLKIWEDYPIHFGVLWDNVQTASLLIPDLPDLPFFCSLHAPVNGPTKHDKLIWAKSNAHPVIGDHPTKVDQKVLVYPSGKVVVKAPPKKELTEEEMEAKKIAKKQKRKERKLRKKNKSEELDSDDSIGGRADMLVSESDSEQDLSDQEEAPQVSGKKKQAVQVKKTKKIKKEESEEESESDVERVEEQYLKELAAQKKSKKGNEKAKGSKKEAVKEESTDEGSDDDDDLDMDSDDFESDDGEAESDEVMDESNFGNDSSSDDDNVKPNSNAKGAKLKQFQKSKPLGGMKNKNNQNPKQKSQNKPGAQKVSSPPQNKKSNKKNTQPQTNKSKSVEKNQFQGVKADQGKKKKNKSTVKNKAIAKKLK